MNLGNLIVCNISSFLNITQINCAILIFTGHNVVPTSRHKLANRLSKEFDFKRLCLHTISTVAFPVYPHITSILILDYT